MNADGTAQMPPRDPSDIQGDSGDQAQDLRFALEQEAIAAALAGHPRGDNDMERGALIEQLEGEDPLGGLEEGDSSDDPIHGGDDITGTDPAPRSIAIDPDASTNPDEPEDGYPVDPGQHASERAEWPRLIRPDRTTRPQPP